LIDVRSDTRHSEGRSYYRPDTLFIYWNGRRRENRNTELLKLFSAHRRSGRVDSCKVVLRPQVGNRRIVTMERDDVLSREACGVTLTRALDHGYGRYHGSKRRTRKATYWDGHGVPEVNPVNTSNLCVHSQEGIDQVGQRRLRYGGCLLLGKSARDQTPDGALADFGAERCGSIRAEVERNRVNIVKKIAVGTG
jgi:hypothetical protein